jgi:hypothetical protein
LPSLDPDDLRAYAARDWAAPERLSLRARVALPLEEKIRISIALYEAMKETRPDWPDEMDRRQDLETHLRLRALLNRAAHVGAR